MKACNVLFFNQLTGQSVRNFTKNLCKHLTSTIKTFNKIMEIAILIILIIIGVIMVAYGYIEDEDNFFLGGITICVLFSLMLGIDLGVNSNFRVKQPITPKIKIECIDNKCDTTYIYNFKNI